MRLFLRALAIAALFVFAVTARASNADPKDSVDYLTVSPPQTTDAGKKIEVIEFFGYFCPHCNAFDPALSEWVKKQGNNIIFKRIPVVFNDPSLPYQQRLYFSLEAMGKVEELHTKIFNAIHIDRQPLKDEQTIVDFVVRQGIDKQKFLEVYNSFSVQSKVLRASQMQAAYKIDGVPTITINGRYLTSPSIAAAGLPPNQAEPVLQAGALKVMDALIAKVRKEQPNSTPPEAAVPAKVDKKKSKK